MQKLEVCISFAPKIPKIPIAVPGRVLVREGEAHLIEKKGKTKASSNSSQSTYTQTAYTQST